MTEQPSLLDLIGNRPGKARRDHPATSRAAALAIAPRTGTQRRKVLNAIAYKPRTDEELQADLRMNANSERPRRVELVEGGWIKDSGLRRPTAAGGESIVWALAREVPAEAA